MAEHLVEQKGIVYIIPADDLFEKWENGEAFIDEYSRLINRKPHRVLKELKHYPAIQQEPSSTSDQESIIEAMVVGIVKGAVEGLTEALQENLPVIWYKCFIPFCHKRIVPLYCKAKETLTTRKLKAEAVLLQAKTSKAAPAQSKPKSKMTRAEADAEKRKVVYCWLEMLNSLKKLHDAGEIDIDTTLAQLTDPATLKRVNGFLSKNPNLLEMDERIMLCNLLGRDLYEENQLIPIRDAEITTIATTYGYKAKPKTRGAVCDVFPDSLGADGADPP
ncbi:MAG: hypothetical protein HFE45_01765 [Oscillospiraceae bacterium]|jgi:hypothetical protein|nr:hypothetical protein [Oscillospiraceae bacterium]